MGIVMLAGLLAFAAPKKKNRVKKTVRTTKTVSETQKKAVKEAPKVMLSKFRLEYQEAAGRACKNSAVMSLSQTSYGDYLYNREFGKIEGWSYEFDAGKCTELMQELSRIAEAKDLYSYKFTELDDEDLTKPRWLVTLKTVEGKEYSIVEYSDGSDLLKLVEAAFKPMLNKVASHELLVPFSEYHYNGDGSLDYRTDHTADGVVCGGYNPKDPNACF